LFKKLKKNCLYVNNFIIDFIKKLCKSDSELKGFKQKLKIALENVKKAKKDYSFKITGKVVKSIGKGQNIELKLVG
jgi:hypothetical protein